MHLIVFIILVLLYNALTTYLDNHQYFNKEWIRRTSKGFEIACSALGLAIFLSVLTDVICRGMDAEILVWLWTKITP